MISDTTGVAFDSRYNYQKLALEGKLAVTIPSQTWVFATAPIAYTTITIPHNLGTIPTFRVFYDYFSYMAPFPFIYGGAGSIDGTPSSGTYYSTGGAGQYSSTLVDTTNLYLRITNRTGSAVNYNIYYRIYYDTAN